jgi:DNA replication protein DnaC
LRKTLAAFDCSFPPSIAQRKLQELATVRCSDPGETVSFRGPPGVGKTHPAVALGLQAAEAGDRVRCPTATDLVPPLAKAWAEQRFEARLQGLCHPTRLLLEEIGSRPRDTREATSRLPRVARRDERGAIILTRHRSSSDWGAILAGDRVIASAILDRRLHHATTIHIKGESSRLKDKRRAGLMQPLTTVPEGGGAMASPDRLREGVGAFCLGASGCIFHR